MPKEQRTHDRNVPVIPCFREGTEKGTSANGSPTRRYGGSVPTVPYFKHYMVYKVKKVENRHVHVCICAYRDFGAKNGSEEREAMLCEKVQSSASSSSRQKSVVGLPPNSYRRG